MWGFAKVPGILAAVALIIAATAPGAFAGLDVCGDCEDEDGDMSCSSALPCEGKMPGFYCKIGSATGKCNDIEHADCEDEPGEVCCGCNIFSWGSSDQSFDPPSEVPDGDLAGWSTTMTVDESLPFDFVDVRLDLNHEQMNDLVITLSHAGVDVVLLDHSVCPVFLSCGVVLSLSDIAVGPVHCPIEDCELYFPGGLVQPDAAYEPLEPLAGFNGLGTMGDWTLTIVDTVPGGFGSVCGWELAFGQEGATPVEGPLSWGIIKALYR